MVRPFKTSYRFFSLFMVRSPGFGSYPIDLRPFKARFHYTYVAIDLSLPIRYPNPPSFPIPTPIDEHKHHCINTLASTPLLLNTLALTPLH